MSYHMPHQLRSRHLGGISVLSLLLIIAGCSSGQSTTGSALSKELSQCYTEYVNLHGDIKKAYKAQLSSGIASQSEYGKAHYEGMGATEGRALPQGCGEHLQLSSSCYASYVDQNADLLAAFNASGQQDKGSFGKAHYDASGKTEGRALPKGCSYVYTPPPADTSAAYTDDQILAYMNCYDDLRNIRSSNAEKIAFGKAHIRAFGQTEGRTCGLVAAVAEAASSSSGGGGGGSLSRCAGITSSTSKAAGVFTSKADLSTAIDAWIADSTTATATYGEINTWDLSGLTEMTNLFYRKVFSSDIGCWDVSNVTNMTATFDQIVGNPDISDWDVSNVTNMSYMFYYAATFNQDIGSWNTAKVTDMSRLFLGASAFNKSISGWDVGNVSNMFNMFSYASNFNQPIGSWNVSKVTTMNNMFDNATAFNQNLSSWNAAAVASCTAFATGATAWLAAYGGAIASKNPPLSATLIAANCQ